MWKALREVLGVGDSVSGRMGRLHAAARDTAFRPVWYRDFAVADTVDGRFDMLCCMVWLAADWVENRAGHGRPALAAFLAVTVADLDAGLREAGESDQTVGRKVQAMTGALYGRMQAYTAALGDVEGAAGALEQALIRNLWRGQDPGEGAGQRLADQLLELRAWLAGQDTDSLTGRAPTEWPVPRG